MPCVHNRWQLTLLKLSSFLFYSSETDEEEDFLHDKMQKRQKKNLTHTCEKDLQSRKW